MDLSVSGPLIALLLASVILSKEMISSAGKETITVGRYLNCGDSHPAFRFHRPDRPDGSGQVVGGPKLCSSSLSYDRIRRSIYQASITNEDQLWTLDR